MADSANSMANAQTKANAIGLRQDERRERLALFGLSVPAILLVIVIVAIPVGWLFWLSLFNDEGVLSTYNYTRMLESKSYYRIFRTTFNVSFMTTALCVIIAAFLDLLAGSNVRLAGSSPTQRVGQSMGHRTRALGYAFKVGSQHEWYANRHGSHYAAVPCFTIVRLNAHH